MFNNIFNNSKLPSYSRDTVDILRLIRSENVGPKIFFSLLKFFGSAQKALDNIQDFSLKGGRSKPIKVCSESAALKELEALTKNQCYLITYKSESYPELLLQIHDFPPVLACKGDISLLNRDKIIAIVGARNCSITGKAFAAKISRELVDAGYVTVSGLARGIDAAVHAHSIGNTIAVIAGGIDHIYPPENASLYEQIVANGLLIAESPFGSKPLGQHFAQRNRIISGVSLATAVIEAGARSGSIITANFALEQNRDVFAVPGFPMDPRSSGSNQLIKNGAILLESVDDIIRNIVSKEKLKSSAMEAETKFNNFEPYMNSNIQITAKNRSDVLNLLSATAVNLETIAVETGLDLPVIYTICLELELAGKITRYTGNKVALIY